MIDPADLVAAHPGMVDNPLELDYADLLSAAAGRARVTLACVSNEVGGDLVGQRRSGSATRYGSCWRRPAAQTAPTWCCPPATTASPLERRWSALTDGRDALLAVAMNGEPLPIEHGFPARLVVPGLYGYVSATKWVTDLEVTSFAGGPGVLDAARMVGARADQDRQPDRPAGWVHDRRGPGDRGCRYSCPRCSP